METAQRSLTDQFQQVQRRAQQLMESMNIPGAPLLSCYTLGHVSGQCCVFEGWSRLRLVHTAKVAEPQRAACARALPRVRIPSSTQLHTTWVPHAAPHCGMYSQPHDVL